MMKPLFQQMSQVTRERLNYSNTDKNSLLFHFDVLYKSWVEYKSILNHNNAGDMAQEI